MQGSPLVNETTLTWNKIQNRPPGLDDGDNDSDVLGNLACTSGQVPERTGSSWTCSSAFMRTDASTSTTGSLTVDGTLNINRENHNGLRTIGITGHKGENAAAFDMFKITGTGGNQTVELFLTHHHSGGGQHGAFLRTTLIINSYTDIIVAEEHATNFGGGQGFTVTRPDTGTLLIHWNGATTFTSSFSFTGYVRGNGNLSVVNLGMDSLNAN